MDIGLCSHKRLAVFAIRVKIDNVRSRQGDICIASIVELDGVISRRLMTHLIEGAVP